MARAIVIGAFAGDDVRRLAQAATVPVIDAGTHGHSPTQVLADLFTLKEHFLRLRQLRVAYVGAGNNVAHSLMEACALAGVDLAVATPDGYQPLPAVTVQARDRAERHGGHLYLTRDPVAAVKDADVVYTDVWLPMGEAESEGAARTAALRPYQVNADLWRPGRWRLEDVADLHVGGAAARALADIHAHVRTQAAAPAVGGEALRHRQGRHPPLPQRRQRGLQTNHAALAGRGPPAQVIHELDLISPFDRLLDVDRSHHEKSWYGAIAALAAL